MLKSKSQEEKHKDRSCVFCDWKAIKEDLKKGRFQWLEGDENTPYYVILARNPKIMGHILVISKYPYDDISQLDENSKDAQEIFKAILRWVKRLKNLKFDEENLIGKVYVMTICEHWEPNEINPQWKEGDKHPESTEHLHFHLIPRYRTMRTKELAAEKLLARPDSEEWPKKWLEKLQGLLTNKTKTCEFNLSSI